jgi:hypothetical protein
MVPPDRHRIGPISSAWLPLVPAKNLLSPVDLAAAKTN